MYNIEIHNLTKRLSRLPRSFHFTTLDSTSMTVLLDEVWDPADDNIFDVTVETFHLALPSKYMYGKFNTTLTSRFLRHIGPSLRRLIIDVSHFSGYRVDFSQCVCHCVNVRALYFGVVVLGEPDRTSSTLLTMWKLLSDLPPNSIEEIFLTFVVDSVADLKSLTWLKLIARLQQMFRYSKKIVIRVTTFSVCIQEHDFRYFLEDLRQAGLRQLEEEGVVSFSFEILRHGVLQLPVSFDNQEPIWDRLF